MAPNKGVGLFDPYPIQDRGDLFRRERDRMGVFRFLPHRSIKLQSDIGSGVVVDCDGGELPGAAGADQFDANEGKKSQADELVHGWNGKHALTWRVGNCQRGLVTDLGQWPFSSRSSHRSRPHRGQSVKFHRRKRVVPLVHDNFLPVLAQSELHNLKKRAWRCNFW